MELIAQISNGVYSATLKGDFTFSDNPQFRQVIESAGNPDVKQIVLGMNMVGFVDSAALGMLLLAHDEAKKHNKDIHIRGVQGQVKRIFDMARFNHFFTID